MTRNSTIDPATLRFLKRKYKHFRGCSKKSDLVTSHGCTPFGKRSYTVGTRSNLKRFKTRQTAGENVAKFSPVILRSLPLMSSSIPTVLSLSSGTAGWGVYAHRFNDTDISL